MKMEGKTILIISPEPWGKNFVSKHHYANYLSKNNKVFFLNPASGSKLFGSKIDVQQSIISDNLIVVDYKNLKPKLDKFPKNIQLKTYAKQAILIQDELGVKQWDIVWSFDPHRFINQSCWRSHKTIYHSVDFHPNAQYELDIIGSSDHYFGIADLIINSVPSKKKAIKIGHGADLEGFQHNAEVSIVGKNDIKAMYVGNFHKHIDYDLLLKLATKNMDVDFILIGPTSKSNLSERGFHSGVEEKFKSCDNVYFIGSVPSQDLMTYLKEADINLILFKEEDSILHCNPHKVMGYLFSGKVLLSSYIDEYKDANANLISMEKSNDSIPVTFKSIKQNLEKHNSKSLQELRRKFAEQNSYLKKIEVINHIISC
jgi:hypothetical protein